MALCVAVLILARALPCSASEAAEPVPPDSAREAADVQTDDAVPDADDPAEKAWAETLPERDPFWPVGYVKPELRPVEEPDEVDEADKEKEQKQVHVVEIQKKSVWPSLKVLSIAGSGARHIAMLGDGIGIVQKGDVVELRRAGMIYRWDIVEISAKGVASRRKDVAPVGREDERIPYVETGAGL